MVHHQHAYWEIYILIKVLFRSIFTIMRSENVVWISLIKCTVSFQHEHVFFLQNKTPLISQGRCCRYSLPKKILIFFFYFRGKVVP